MYFRDVVGQAALKKQLILNVKHNRVSHAQLFFGPAGVGKLALALAFARFLHCRNRGANDACGTCPSCLKFNRLEHPDLHFIFPTAVVKIKEQGEEQTVKEPHSRLFYNQWRTLLLESPYFEYSEWLQRLNVQNQQVKIFVEDSRDIMKSLSLKAFESNYKVVIIWMAEKINLQASTKLLKTIEEPPPGTVMLFISDNKEEIIKTILSRTQLVKVPLIADNDMEDFLVKNLDCPANQAKKIAFLANGNFCKAKELLEENGEQQADLNMFRDWMRHCLQKKANEILDWVDKFSKQGREKQIAFLQYGLSIFRMCLFQNFHAKQALRLEADLNEFVEKFSPFVNHKNALELIEAFNQAIYHVERNANPKILFTDLSFNLARLIRQSK